MNRPWLPERAVDEPLACSLIERQFPDIAPVTLKLLGVRWDNTASLVNSACVFRSPRRQAAVDLLETERRLLPSLALQLPLPIPVPSWHGEPSDAYPWPFAGYPFLEGRTACDATLNEQQRMNACDQIAGFLVKLHASRAGDAKSFGARPDALDRLNVVRRTPPLRQRLEELNRLGLLDNLPRLLELLDSVQAARRPAGTTLVHGDCYARHLLVDKANRLCGVIDWGDVHLGDPAIDLAVACSFLPPSSRSAFERIYGSIDEETWKLATFKALQTAAFIVSYGHDAGDKALVEEGRTSLRYLAT